MIAVSYSASGSFLYGASLSFKLYYFYCDYFAQNNNITYSARGGRSTLGLYCGAFIVVDVTVSSAHLYRGASLSFKSYETFYCDYFYQRSGSHYARRGGTSGSNRMAGIFFNNIYITIADTGSSNGACLSFKQIIVEDPAKSSTIITEKERIE